MDAKFLVKMMKSLDLPNAPMMCWVMYLSLFSFEVKHVLADKHLAPDGLSHRRQSTEDSEDEDTEEYLDKFIGCSDSIPHKQYPPPLPPKLLMNFVDKVLSCLMATSPSR